MNRGAWLAVAASLAAVIACGSNNNGSNNSGNSGGNGSFPYTGPSCSASAINEGCWGCLQSDCGGGCLTSACNDFFNCFCNCAQGDSSCYQTCSSSVTASCQQCILSISSCEQSSCSSACGTSSGVGPGGSGGSGSSGGFGSSSSGASSGSSSGPGMFQSCSGNGQPCADGSTMQFCETGTGSMCTSAYYQVGKQIFSCASCSDTATCAQEAYNACGPTVIDAGPPADVGPPDAPVFDAGAPTCNSHACGTMGQSMSFCENIDPSGNCTAAWYEVAGQIFDCNSCVDCTTAAQEASKSCP